MLIKVATATGKVLDYMVAKAEKLDVYKVSWSATAHVKYPGAEHGVDCPKFSTDPADGQPILEREAISVLRGDWFTFTKADKWLAIGQHNTHGLTTWFNGPTMLVAGLRCHVSRVLGEEVDVPDELVNHG
jgi:hypothetical protein